MSASTHTLPQAASDTLPSRKLSVWLFLGSEVLFFSALILTYIVLRLSSDDWPSYEEIAHTLAINVTAINTFILILSSVSVVLALHAVENGNQRGLVTWLGVTLVLGTIFLGVQAYEYGELIAHGLTLTSTPISGTDVLFATTFYTMTGFHGMHVLGGVLTLVIVLAKAARGLYPTGHHEGVELFGLYWHFVDLVWIILFTIVYLI